MAGVLCGRLFRGLALRPQSGPAAVSLLWSAFRSQRSQSTSPQTGYVPKTSLSAPPWPDIKLPDPAEEAEHHAEVVQKINNLIAAGQFGRLFAVVHFASRQWKVTNEDLILIQQFVDVECGDRIRLEKDLTSACTSTDHESCFVCQIYRKAAKDRFSSAGLDLVRIEATVVEKTDSCPKIWMKFWRRHRYRKKKMEFDCFGTKLRGNYSPLVKGRN